MNTDAVRIDLMEWDILYEDFNNITFQYPGVHEPNNWYLRGFEEKNDYSADLRDWHGLELEVELQADGLLELKAEVGLLVNKSPLPEKVEFAAAQCLISGHGRHSVTIPLHQFDDKKSLSGKWKFVRSIRISGEWKADVSADDALKEPFKLLRMELRRRQAVHISAPIRSIAAPGGGKAEYDVTVHNCTGREQPVSFNCEKYGWETMSVKLDPPFLILEPWESKKLRVSVNVPEKVAPGGHERQKITAVPGGLGAAADVLELFTLRSLPHPYIKMTEPEWNGVREKVQSHEWARELLAMYEQRADQWMVPEIHIGPYMFETHNSHEAENAAIAWKVTGRGEFGEKAALFLRRLADPEKGYPATGRTSHQELVHEGELFKHAAVVYDLIYDSGLLSEEDHANVKRTFRLFIKLIDFALCKGGTSNWTLAEMIGALYCSQSLQDYEWMNRFLYGTGGFTDHLSKGTLDDGWWYECSVGYNLMAAGLFSEITQSCRPWGINLSDMWVPAHYYDQVTPGAKPDIDGLSLDIWGPSRMNYRSISQLWDSLLPFADYRGVLFGINDSAESKLPGISPRGYMDARFDLAYYLYRRPEYADVLLTCELADRDLLYAVPDLTQSESKPYLSSAYADNAGVAVLRSQTEGRAPREQIQAVVKYGSHGGAHGHYDRVSLLSVMRYGRSFYNPENIWYHYHTFMYKFYVQNSLTHNMVVVDQKLQDPVEGRRLLFHSGRLFQACAVENKARWSHPPYGGWRVNGEKTFAERAWNEGRYVPVPEEAPDYSKRTAFTEPVLQRRMTVVTDDYVVLFDYLNGEEEHTYDSLFHCKGLIALEADEKRHRGHTEQWNPDPLGSAQFITDCDWYDMAGPVKAGFEMGFGAEYDNRANRTAFNEDGPLKIDHYTVWPPQLTMIVGTDPEYFPVQKQLYYTVEGDGLSLTEGKFGAWILGRDELNLSIEGVGTLSLRVRTDDVMNELGVMNEPEKTIFWGDPYVVTAEGEIRYLADLPLSFENTDQGRGIGTDYEGGPVKLAGKRFDRAVPANPADSDREGIISVDLSGLNAVRFVASIGGDFPLGDETYRRKMLSARVVGKSARFISVIETYEHTAQIISASAASADEISVELSDGRRQIIKLSGFEGDGEAISLQIREIGEDGRTVCEEASGDLKSWSLR
ncbi:heparinase II/III family protein [Paenibacillus sp. sptzw28]|uniref:COG1470 family protein n=1 Tax=Paenibacillus sp. sptzw28 TaxID=715179 RepID=UPI0021629FB5|nr:heparinase II/III family protein [Paenibacillus sp. sptzw28]